MRGLHTIKVGEKSIDLYFNTWVLKRFCKLNGEISLTQFLELLQTGLTVDHLTSLLLCAAEYIFVKDKKQSPYNDIDASDWIDELGGINGAAFVELLGSAAKSLMDGGAKGEGEKKSQ